MSLKIASFLGIVVLALASVGCQGFGLGGSGSGSSSDATLGSSADTSAGDGVSCPVSKEQKIAMVYYDLGKYCGSASLSIATALLSSSSYADAVNESNRENLFCLDAQGLTKMAASNWAGSAGVADADAVIKAVESHCAEAAESSIEKLRNEAPASLMESDVANLLLLYRPVRQFCAEFGLATGMAPPSWLAGVVESCTASLASSATDKGKSTVSAGAAGGAYMSSDSFKSNLAILNANNCDKFGLWLNWNSKEGLQKIVDECAAANISTNPVSVIGSQDSKTTTSAVATTDVSSVSGSSGVTQLDMIKQIRCSNASQRLAQLNGDFSSCN